MYLLKIAFGPAAIISTEPNIGSRACMPGKLLSVFLTKIKPNKRRVIPMMLNGVASLEVLSKFCSFLPKQFR